MRYQWNYITCNLFKKTYRTFFFLIQSDISFRVYLAWIFLIPNPKWMKANWDDNCKYTQIYLSIYLSIYYVFPPNSYDSTFVTAFVLSLGSCPILDLTQPLNWSCSLWNMSPLTLKGIHMLLTTFHMLLTTFHMLLTIFLHTIFCQRECYFF